MSRIMFLIISLVLSGAVFAKDAYPPNIVRFIVPYPPGSLPDTTARIIADQLKGEWDKPVIAENKPGASGQIAAEYVSRSAPDGTTLLISLPDMTVIAPLVYPKLRYDPVTELQPVTLFAKQAFVLVVRENLPVNDFAQLLAYAKANPGKLRSASWGEGSTGHLALELLKIEAGIDILHVPYKGAAAAMNDLIGGHVDMMFVGFSTGGPHIASGRIRVLGRTAMARSPLTPGIPTLSESGLPGYNVQSWYGVMAPAGTPQEVVAVIQRAVTKAVSSPEFQKRIASFSAEPTAGTTEEFAAQLESDRKKWGDLVRTVKIQID